MRKDSQCLLHWTPTLEALVNIQQQSSVAPKPPCSRAVTPRGVSETWKARRFTNRPSQLALDSFQPICFGLAHDRLFMPWPHPFICVLLLIVTAHAANRCSRDIRLMYWCNTGGVEVQNSCDTHIPSVPNGRRYKWPFSFWMMWNCTAERELLSETKVAAIRATNLVSLNLLCLESTYLFHAPSFFLVAFFLIFLFCISFYY